MRSRKPDYVPDIPTPDGISWCMSASCLTGQEEEGDGVEQRTEALSNVGW